MRRSDDLLEIDTLLGDSAREFCSQQEAAGAGRAATAAEWQPFVATGWPGMALGEENGGIGADLTQCCIVLKEAGRALLPQSAGTDIMIAPMLANHAPAIAELMPGLLSGDVRFALALPGSTPFAERQGRITGESQLAPGGDQATHVIMPAETGTGTRLYLAGAGSDGLTRENRTLIDGRSAARFTASDLATGMLVAIAPNSGPGPLLSRLEALAICCNASEALGAFEAAFEMTVDYVQVRQQFRQPLAAFQAVEHAIADVYCELEKFRSLQMALVRALEEPAEFDPRAVARARLCQTRNVLKATGQLIQISGGIAITEDYKLGRIYRRLQADAALFGGAPRAIEMLTDEARPAV